MNGCRTSSTNDSEDCRGPPIFFSKTVSNWLSLALFISWILSIFGYLIYEFGGYFCAWCSTLISYRSTKTPRPPPKWLRKSKEPIKMEESTERKTVYTRNYKKEFVDKQEILQANRNVIIYIQDIVQLWIPEETCVFKVPRNQFKCDDSDFTAFELKDGPEIGYFSYQQYGNTIQATFYHEEGVKWLAGFCVYIENPYRHTVGYPRSVLKMLMSMPDYYPSKPNESIRVIPSLNPNDPELLTRNHFGIVRAQKFKKGGEENVFIQEDPMDENKFNRSEENISIYTNLNYIRKLRVRMCNNQPINVGWTQNGRMVHVEWKNGEAKIVECPICGGENPPEYESLSNVDLYQM